jgi:hypothetical protein
MTKVNVEFHRLADSETLTAFRWYASRSPATADRFLAELERAVLEIAASPDRWPAH